MDYINTEPEFYKFLTFNEKITKNTRTNYISWLRFLSQNHSIDNFLSLDKIEEIISIEKLRKSDRNLYTKDKDLSNFKSSLRKYLKFLNEDYYNNVQQSFVEEEMKIIKNTELNNTEKEHLCLSRIGQGRFRKNLIKYWNGCSITNINKTNLLIASHIKPWRESDNIERLDCFNGLLLVPNFDKLFDKGYINFDASGKIIISKLLNEQDRITFNLNSQIQLRNLEKKHIDYLEYHREYCFIG